MNLDQLYLLTMMFGYLSIIGIVAGIGEMVERHYAKKIKYDFEKRLHNGEVLRSNNIF
mgnify:CR=1 FL=1|jgi:hypothetical protein